MAINYVNYDVLNEGKTLYAKQAGAIDDVITAINSMNAQLQEGWSNETARAFIQRIDSDHIPKLRNAAAAIQEVSDYIGTYLANIIDIDTGGANAL